MWMPAHSPGRPANRETRKSSRSSRAPGGMRPLSASTTIPCKALHTTSADSSRLASSAGKQLTNSSKATRNGAGVSACPNFTSVGIPRNFNRSFELPARKAGLPRIRVHDTRHTCASMLAALGVHPRVAMRILRHSQISVTMNVYTQITGPETRRALDQLNASLDSENP
jgi:hypothetical protein